MSDESRTFQSVVILREGKLPCIAHCTVQCTLCTVKGNFLQCSVITMVVN